jgi:hypothetical protein
VICGLKGVFDAGVDSVALENGMERYAYPPISAELFLAMHEHEHEEKAHGLKRLGCIKDIMK